jgi:hypothetical protein
MCFDTILSMLDMPYKNEANKTLHSAAFKASDCRWTPLYRRSKASFRRSLKSLFTSHNDEHMFADVV